MNVLVVALHFPFPTRTGVNMRVYQLMRQIGARHEVELLSYAWPDEADAVEQLREEFTVHVVARQRRPQLARRAEQLRSLFSTQPFCAREFHTPEMQRAITGLCAERAYDVVQLEAAPLCGFDLPAGPRVVLDAHNIEYEVLRRMCESERSRLRRAFHRREYRRFRAVEERLWARVDGCAVTSDRELPTVSAAAPGTAVRVIPNAVDLDYFAPASGAVAPRTLVFNGTLGYRPNVDAAHHLVEEVWPLVLAQCPDARLTIVGRASEGDRRRLSRPSVTVTGEVPDIRPYMHSAAVVAVPIRMGGGTRLKVVEALAMGKPMVSTALGCEGIEVRHGEHLLIADGARAFADAVLRLFADRGLQRRLGHAGRELAQREYSWDLAGERLDALHAEVTDSVYVNP